MEHELKHCPFCGGKAEVEMDESWYWEWEVYCTKCGATFGNHFDSKGESVSAWNNRVDEKKETRGSEGCA